MLEHQARARRCDRRVRRQLLDDEVAQRIGVVHGDVQHEVLGPAQEEQLPHLGPVLQVGAELPDVLARSGPDADADQRFEAQSAGGRRHDRGEPGDDPAVDEGGDPRGAGRRRDAEQLREAAVGRAGVLAQQPDEAAVDIVTTDVGRTS